MPLRTNLLGSCGEGHGADLDSPPPQDQEEDAGEFMVDLSAWAELLDYALSSRCSAIPSYGERGRGGTCERDPFAREQEP